MDYQGELLEGAGMADVLDIPRPRMTVIKFRVCMNYVPVIMFRVCMNYRHNFSRTSL
jgi:hypothetical protein